MQCSGNVKGCNLTSTNAKASVGAIFAAAAQRQLFKEQQRKQQLTFLCTKIGVLKEKTVFSPRITLFSSSLCSAGSGNQGGKRKNNRNRNRDRNNRNRNKNKKNDSEGMENEI